MKCRLHKYLKFQGLTFYFGAKMVNMEIKRQKSPNLRIHQTASGAAAQKR